MRQHGGLDEGALAGLANVLAAMQRVEASVIAGRPVKVPRPLFEDAARMSREVLEACGADATHLRRAPPQAAVDGGSARDDAEPRPDAGGDNRS